MQTKTPMGNNIVRALRLPFLSATILPFIFGVLIARGHFRLLPFLAGLIAAMATHLSANLINDYADSRSGADNIDLKYYQFFGGSKLIQEKVFSQKFYLKLAIVFASIAGLAVLWLAITLHSFLPLMLYAAIIFLSWQYSAKPLCFSYRRCGEIFLFLLFGPCLVMGGYFTQTGIFPDLKSFLLSLPFGFLTTAVLFANEVPDLTQDLKARKFTWASLTGEKNAFMLYLGLMFLAFFSILLNIKLNYLSLAAVFSLIIALLAVKAAQVMKNYPSDKMKLVESSKLTIAVQTLVSLVLIISLVLK